MGPRLPALLLGLGAVASACGDASSYTQEPGTATAMSHIHGLGVDPADDILYAATHFGLFRIDDDGTRTRVADRWQDTMAFTVAGPGRFLASGHPDMAEQDLPSHLGLLESTDAGETWEILSLGAEADFHALDLAQGRITGYDSQSGRILTSSDGITWDIVATADVVDLAADPRNPTRIVATSPGGQLSGFETDGVESQGKALEAPELVFVDWPVADLLVGISQDGSVHLSQDGGSTWRETGGVPGEPQALDVTPDRWHAATTHGIFESADQGQTWTQVVNTAG